MKYPRTWVLLLTAAMPLVAGAQDVFRLSFHGTGRFLDDNGNLHSRRVNADDLIARCVGEAGLSTNNSGTNRQFELVFNPDGDRVQVIDLTNGTFLCDILQFQAGVSNVAGRRVSRLAFVFLPEQNEAAGTAILTETFRKNLTQLRSLNGQAQFALQSLEPGSSAGAQFSTAPDTNAVTTTNNAALGGSLGSGTNGLGSGTNAGSIWFTNPVTSTNSLPITSPPTAVAPPVPTNSTLIVSTNVSGPGNTGFTNTVGLLPPLPPGTSSTPTNSIGTTNAATTNLVVTPTNSVSVITSPTNSVITISNSVSNPPTVPGLPSSSTTVVGGTAAISTGGAASSPSIATNTAGGSTSSDLGIPAVTGEDTSIDNLTMTNGIIISGSFSTGKKIGIQGP